MLFCGYILTELMQANVSYMTVQRYPTIQITRRRMYVVCPSWLPVVL